MTMSFFTLSFQIMLFLLLKCSVTYHSQTDVTVFKLLLSRVLLCEDCSPPGPSVRGTSQTRTLEWAALPFSSSRGTSQTRTLEWAAIPFSSRSSRPRDWTLFSCNGRGGFFTTEPLRSPYGSMFIVFFYYAISNLRDQAVSCSSLCYPYGIRAPCWQQTGGSVSRTEWSMILWYCTKLITLLL